MTLDLTQVLMTLITVVGSVVTVIYTKQAKGHADSAYQSASMRPLYYKPETLPSLKPVVNPRIDSEPTVSPSTSNPRLNTKLDADDSDELTSDDSSAEDREARRVTRKTPRDGIKR